MAQRNLKADRQTDIPLTKSGNV